MAEIGWRPEINIVNNVSNSVGGVLKVAGLENAKGALSTFYFKDSTDPTWKDDPAMKEWVEFMDKWYPEGDKTTSFNVYAYAVSQTLAQVLRQCGDDLTRENVMRQAANLKNFHVPLLLPGIVVNTGPNDFYPIEQMQMARFTGERWELFGSVMSGDVGSGS
jgi:branched-chain amino acid transport system substrate-binding protein